MKLDLDKIAASIIILLALANPAAGKSFSSLNNKGNKFYLKGKYQKALELYKKAEIQNPNSPILSNNLGNVGYQQQAFNEAERYYQRALENKDKKQLADTYYNLGNNLFRQGRIEESVAAYQSCLERNPDDLDAKYNLEFIRRMKQQNQKSKESHEQEKQDKDRKKEGQDQSGEKNQKKDKGQQQPRGESDQGKKKEEERQLGQKQEQEQQQEESSRLQPEMSREEAERILEAIKDQEKELLKKQEKFGQVKAVRIGRDW